MLKGLSDSKPSGIPYCRFSIHISCLPASLPASPARQGAHYKCNEAGKTSEQFIPPKHVKDLLLLMADPTFSREKDSSHGGAKAASISSTHLPTRKDVLVAEAAAQHKTEQSPGAVYSFTAEVSSN